MFRKSSTSSSDRRPGEFAALRGARLSEARSEPGPRYSITFSPAGFENVQMDWIGVLDGVPLTPEEVHAGFRMWLDTAPVSDGGVPERTIKIWIRGSCSEVTFRTDWISGFSVSWAG